MRHPITYNFFIGSFGIMMVCLMASYSGIVPEYAKLLFDVAFVLAAVSLSLGTLRVLLDGIYPTKVKLQAQLIPTGEVIAESESLEDLLCQTHFTLLLRYPDQDPNTIEWELVLMDDDSE